MNRVLEIGLEADGGIVLAPPRLADPARILVGKTPEQAIKLVSLLHAACPAAQSAAASMALGLAHDPAWDRAIAHEILAQHALVILRDWPRAFGGEIDHAALRGLLAGQWPDDVEQRLFGSSAADILTDYQQWLADSDARTAALLRRTRCWPICEDQLAGAADPSYAARLADAAGPEQPPRSLFSRCAARVFEAAMICDEITRKHYPVRHGRRDGSGWAEAARGHLRHGARLRHGRIVDYEIVTPSGRTTHLDGLLGRLLAQLTKVPDTDRAAALAIVLSCADPCMDIRIVWGESHA